MEEIDETKVLKEVLKEMIIIDSKIDSLHELLEEEMEEDCGFDTLVVSSDIVLRRIQMAIKTAEITED